MKQVIRLDNNGLLIYKCMKAVAFDASLDEPLTHSDVAINYKDCGKVLFVNVSIFNEDSDEEFLYDFIIDKGTKKILYRQGLDQEADPCTGFFPRRVSRTLVKFMVDVFNYESSK